MASRADYLSPTKEFPDHATFRAAGAHRDQPISVKFELVGAKEALHHRFLAYSSPSRSPNPRHLTVLTRPGFVRAAPTLPGTPRIRLPSATPTCYDRPTVQVFHLHSINKRLTAHGAPPPHPRPRLKDAPGSERVRGRGHLVTSSPEGVAPNPQDRNTRPDLVN
jgi:hypothetical protein